MKDDFLLSEEELNRLYLERADLRRQESRTYNRDELKRLSVQIRNIDSEIEQHRSIVKGKEQ